MNAEKAVCPRKTRKARKYSARCGIASVGRAARALRTPSIITSAYGSHALRSSLYTIPVAGRGLQPRPARGKAMNQEKAACPRKTRKYSARCGIASVGRAARALRTPSIITFAYGSHALRSSLYTIPVAGRGLQPRPKRLKGEDMAVVIENGRDGGATPVPLGWSLSAERFRLHSHAERGNDEFMFREAITDRIQSLKARAARPTAEASRPGTAASENRVFANPARFLK